MKTHIITRDEHGNAELNGELLVRRYDAGDCDTIDFDKPDMENLKAALYDEREMSDDIKYEDNFSINGVVFSIDE
jgi:hypothetical protein